jgi:hypothetical protein
VARYQLRYNRMELRADEEDRTPDLTLTKGVLCQLSYDGEFGADDGNRTRMIGLEDRDSAIELHPLA